MPYDYEEKIWNIDWKKSKSWECVLCVVETPEKIIN